VRVTHEPRPEPLEHTAPNSRSTHPFSPAPFPLSPSTWVLHTSTSRGPTPCAPLASALPHPHTRPHPSPAPSLGTPARAGARLGRSSRSPPARPSAPAATAQGPGQTAGRTAEGGERPTGGLGSGSRPLPRPMPGRVPDTPPPWPVPSALRLSPPSLLGLGPRTHRVIAPIERVPVRHRRDRRLLAVAVGGVPGQVLLRGGAGRGGAGRGRLLGIRGCVANAGKQKRKRAMDGRLSWGLARGLHTR
jgi:hypothetical protein